MKNMWIDFKKIRSSRFRDIQKSAKNPNFEWGCAYTGGEKTDWFLRSQERKYTKISIASKYDVKQHSDAT